MAHEGTFYGGPNEDEEFTYETVRWKEPEGDWKEDISDSDLIRVEDITIRISNEITGESAFNTYTGPFEDWETIEEIMEYTWGPEGNSQSFSGVAIT